MTTCIIAEKPSVARDIARIVGANRREDGFLEGADYLVTWAFGHLITLSMPEQYGYGAYKAEELPIVPQPFQLMVRQIRKGKDFEDAPTALKQLKIIRSCFEKSDQIIVATDAGREGELIFRYISNDKVIAFLDQTLVNVDFQRAFSSFHLSFSFLLQT